MKANYKNTLNKVKLSESEKEKAKALFHEVNNEKESKMGVKRVWKPVAVMAASLALVLFLNAVIPMLQRKQSDTVATATDNYFVVTAYAKELTKTGKVFPDKYSSLSGAECGTKGKEISFAFGFPLKCKGKNIDTITYQIKNGAFQISNPKGKSVVVAGEKVKKGLNVPGSSKESEEKEKLTYEWEQYKSFTVKYDNQINNKTCIDVVDTSDIWSEEKLSQYKSFRDSIIDRSLEEDKKIRDFLTKDMGITCTVTYKDGSKETKNIGIFNEIKRPSEVLSEKVPAEKDQKTVITYFNLQ
ncbi:MAG: hypothetical protein J1F22_02475 [Lachnospiraceae bacterium]|nr:hypothetical protein [Lachnospiraceae bacterium]